MSTFSAREPKSLLFLGDTWLSQLIVEAVFLRIKAGKVAESLRENTFLKESLPIVILRIVGILGFEPILSFSLSSKEDKAIALEETFLDAKETEILLEEHLAIQQVWDLSLRCTYLPALKLALKSNLDESGDIPTYWE